MIAAPIMYRLLADLVILVHFGFVVFAVAGGLLMLKWRWFVWIHSAAIIWAASVELFGWVCPLTPLENWLRARAGEAVYNSDFIARWLFPMLYPAGLTRDIQIVLGIFVIVVNLAIYGLVFRAGAKHNQRDGVQ